VPTERHAPSAWHVIRAIARREVGIALRRRLVRLLFLGSLVPPLVFGIILIVRLMAEKAVGVHLGWDPVYRFLQVQVAPVVLLSLGLGTPLVARDRAEDVLYLYAVRPVSPWHYAVGKMLAVAGPAFGLLILPGMLIAVMRQGLLPDQVHFFDSIWLVGKIGLAALFLAIAFAGASVGPSAAVKRARWALLLALALFTVPDSVIELIFGNHAIAVGPAKASEMMLGMLFEGAEVGRGVAALGVLLLYGVLGCFVTLSRVREEMRP
jgi:ABC-type transport system involved in multi-copper enzyme maturation permease subunit